MTHLSRYFRWLEQSRYDPRIVAMFSLWVLAMISLPVVKWFFGGIAIRFGISSVVFTQIILVIMLLAKNWGGIRTLRTTLIVLLIAWGAEAWGNSTGFLFGPYSYTLALQPQVFGVPLLIPLAWMMMIPSAWAVGNLWVSTTNTVRHALASASAMTAWDLFLDPQMVRWEFWIWESEGAYFGIPFTNFVGWFLVSLVITLLVRPTRLPVRPLVAIYLTTWILQSIGQLFFWNLAGPALFGFAGMGSILLGGYLFSRRRKAK